jgi:hypothetical protein
MGNSTCFFNPVHVLLKDVKTPPKFQQNLPEHFPVSLGELVNRMRVQPFGHLVQVHPDGFRKTWYESTGFFCIIF